MLGFGLSLTDFGSKGGVSDSADSRSLAAILAGAEADVLSMDFTDLSILIRDTVTPANNFAGGVNSKLTYTAPSAKWILGANGLYASASTLRTEYNTSGVALGIRAEESRANRATFNRDLSNAAWAKTNCTAARTATGADGVSSNATTLTATGANATAIQSITSASALRIGSGLIRRRTGSGIIEITLNNGALWTDITAGITSAGYVIKESPAATITNPQFGFRIQTSGDEIDVDFTQEESGDFRTSPIEVPAGAAVTRAIDNISIAQSLFGFDGDGPGTFFAKVYNPSGLNVAVSPRIVGFDTGAKSPLLWLSADATDRLTAFDGASTTTAIAGSGNIRTNGAKVAFGYSPTPTTSMCFNGGAVATSVLAFNFGASNPMAIGSTSHASPGQSWNGYIQQIMYVKRRLSDAELQTLTT